MNPAAPLPPLSLAFRIGTALVALGVDGLAVGWQLLAGMGFEMHDTPDLRAAHRLTAGATGLLAGLLLANGGLYVLLRRAHNRQATRWFGVGALLPMMLLVLSRWNG